MSSKKRAESELADDAQPAAKRDKRSKHAHELDSSTPLFEVAEQLAVCVTMADSTTL